MSLPITDADGVVQTVADGNAVSFNAGLGYDANQNLCVTAIISDTDVWQNGWRRDSRGSLIITESTPGGQPFVYNAGWPTDKVTGAVITQSGTPSPTDPRVAGVAVGPLGGVYMTEGGTPVCVPVSVHTAPAITGTGEVGTTLYFEGGDTYYGTQPVTTMGPIWYADATPIIGGFEFVVLEQDVGKTITARMRATNACGAVDNFSNGIVAYSSAISGAGFSKGFSTGFDSLTFNPAVLWPNGAASPGQWTDPPYTASLFSTSAGANAISAIGTVLDTSNPVGLALDRKGGATALADPGIHLSQATGPSRPVASARSNLLLTNAFGTAFDSSADMTGAGVVNASVAYAGGINTVTMLAPGTSVVRMSKDSGNSQVIALEVPTVYSMSVRGVGSSIGKTVSFTAHHNEAPFTSTPVVLTGAFQRLVGPVAASVTYTAIRAYLVLSDDGTTANLVSGESVEVRDIQFEAGASATAYQFTDTTTYDASVGPTCLKFDGVDDSLASATFAAGTLTSSMDCLIAVRRDSAANAVCGLYESVADANKVFGIAESGSGSAAIGTGAGTPTVWVDGTQLAGGTAVTRGTLHTALTAGNWHILELRGMDLSTWTAAGFGAYTSYILNGAAGGVQLFASGQDANRDLSRAQMAAYFGVTLP